jgi:hypothetical protein
MTRGCHWWSIVMLLRPTAIAIAYNSRDRGTNSIQGGVDWRVTVRAKVQGLSMPVSTLQAAAVMFM